MLLGSACSEVTESLAKVVPHWNIVQVSQYLIRCSKETKTFIDSGVKLNIVFMTLLTTPTTIEA